MSYPDNFDCRAFADYWADARPGPTRADVDAFAADWAARVAAVLAEARTAFIKSPLAEIGHWRDRPLGLEDAAEAARQYVDDCLVDVSIAIGRGRE